jgi:type III secretion protein N (ATPase)
MSAALAVERLRARIAGAELRPLHGRVERVLGTAVEVRLGGLRVGELCRLVEPGREPLLAEVVSVAEHRAVLAPVGEVAGLSARAVVEATGRVFEVAAGEALLGRVLDGLGRPIDGGPQPSGPLVPVEGAAPPPLARAAVARPLPLGLRAVDGLLTCAEGQRIGIFGPPGSGKSSLIARILGGAEADVFVLALVGERGREVREFLERHLGPEQRRRSVVIAATSDRPALERMRAASVATAVAEWFRDCGRRVVLLVDSVTRLARALREVGLAAGEPPTRRGFPPSVFATLPRLLERAGQGECGSITGFYTVLVEGELESDPVAEEVKSILDGHIVLSPRLAEADHHPAIDVLASRSRVMEAAATEEHRAAAAAIRRLIARHAEVEFLARVGEYRAGSDPLADEALRKIGAINDFLRQPAPAPEAFARTLAALRELAA